MRKRRIMLIIAAMLTLALVACGQSNEETPVVEETQDVSTAPTPTEVPIEAEIETLPMLDQLLASDSCVQYLNKNFKSTMNLAIDMDYGNTPISIKMTGENLSYENTSYTDVSLKMEYMGIEEANEKQYSVYDTDGMITEYTFSPIDNVWYKSEYFDVDDGNDVSLVRRIAEMDADDFSVIETTSDDENIYIATIPDPKFAIDGAKLFNVFGVEDIEFGGICKFVFDKDTKELVSIEFLFELDNLVTEDMKENSIASISVDEFSIMFIPNTTPVIVPDDVIANAMAQ